MTVSAVSGDPQAQHAAALPPFTDTAATPDLRVAEHFLTLLDDSAESFTFQTFDDTPAKRPRLARIMHGTIGQVALALTTLNDDGAGIFVMINAGDGRGRKTENVTGVRAVFADFDGTPLPESWPLEPHIVVESSPGRLHAYWLVSGVELGEFKQLQEAIAARLGSDPTVCDLPRVMRLPGFIHRKGRHSDH
jgi:RepB DNA-primase from phage plasmid